MRELKDDTLIEDMNLNPGDLLKIEDAVYEYVGIVESNGKQYDKIVPLKSTFFIPRD